MNNALLVSTFAAIFLLQGCARSQEAFLSIQTCVVDQNGLDELARVMRDIAHSERLQFIDNSAAMRESLKATAADRHAGIVIDHAVDLHIEGKGGMGVTASNLSLPSYQVALGFTEGSEPNKAHRLAEQLTQELKQRWNVQKVARGKGVFPMKSCGFSNQD